MAIGTRIGPDGRPIEDPFFQTSLPGFAQQLATLPGTPILGGGASAGSSLPPPGTATGGGGLGPDGMPNVTNSPNPGRYAPPGGALGGFEQPGGYTGSGEETPEGAYGDWTGTRPTAGSGGTPVSNTPPSGGNPIQTNPGLPPPASTAGTGNFFGGQSPWAQNVGASINDQPVSFASPGNPNPNYITPEAAGKIGQAFGANVVEQNRSNMASPGSSAPSSPIYGLDYGVGDIQGADVAATGLARGDRPEDIAARYAAGLKNTGWGGVAPTVSRADADGMWNYGSPVSTYDPSQSNAEQAKLIAWLRGQIGQG